MVLTRAAKWGVVITVGVLGIVGTSCGDGGDDAAERLIEDASGGDLDVDIDDDGQSVRIEGEDGDSEFTFGTGELPDGFPEDFPMPDDVSVESGTSVDGGAGFSVGLDYAGSVDDAADFYRDALPNAGFEVTATQQQEVEGRQTVIFAISGNGWDGTVSAADSPDGDTLISIILTRDEG